MKKVKNFLREFSVSILSLSLAVPALVSAQTNTGPATPTLPTNGGTPYAASLTTAQSLLQLICTIFSWAFYFLIVLAVVFVVIGAYRYLTSSGDSEKVKNATNTLLYAAIAVAVALLAKAIPSIVANFLGASTTNGGTGGFLAC